MSSIAILVDYERDRARALGERVASAFREHGCSVAQLPQEPCNADLIVTVGGDGTLLHAARAAVECDAPIIGINTGRLGFLTELDEGDPRIDRLPELFEGGLLIEERLALQVEFAGHQHFALNDVIVRKGGVPRIVPFTLRLNEEAAAQVPADGICIATPTGSTAYFLSAGGSIISPKVDAIGIVPLLPHTLFSRPIIAPASSRIEVGCDVEPAHAQLECDGRVVAEIDAGASVVIHRHPKAVRFARVEPLRFFERLGKKLQWGVSIKERPR